jgi:cyclopropane-fatty-acyl-phospholipid synthase
MSTQHQQAAGRHYNAAGSHRSRLAALLGRILPRPKYGRLAIDTPTGERVVIEGRLPGAHAQLKAHSWKFLRRVVARGDIGFAESYIAGDLSSPNLHALMTFAVQNADTMEPTRWVRASRILLRLRHALNRNTKRGSRRNIAAHYDLGNDFYAKWLDSSMSYSSALFSAAGQTLEEAQDTKLKRVFELMDLSGGEQVLEIGCGWGGLAEQLIDRYRCNLTGVTLSLQQLEFARERLRTRKLSQYGDLRLQDYRDISGTFDRIVSIEMVEAVGAAFWPTYFKQLRDNLRPGGIAVLQAITIDEARYESYRRTPDFIQRYIFPGGMLPTTTTMEREIAAAGLQLVKTEFFGESYARTLVEWQRRFQRAWPIIERLGFDAAFKRTWEYYLSYCQVGFEAGTVNVGFYKLARPTL